jgi:hypothetical protein
MILLATMLLAGADPEPSAPPKGPPPATSYIKIQDGRVVQLAVEMIAQQDFVDEKIVVDGKEFLRKVLRTRYVPVSRMMLLSTGEGSFSTAGGKKLTAAEAMKRLAAGEIGVISSDGKPVDKEYLKALKPGTLVVVPVPAPLPPPIGRRAPALPR